LQLIFHAQSVFHLLEGVIVILDLLKHRGALLITLLLSYVWFHKFEIYLR
jgi:hypothetical protein